MKEILDPNEIEALADYRLERAWKTLGEVSYLDEGGHYNAALSRLYYACYYAVLALFIKNNINASTHAGVKQMLGLHFIITNKIPQKSGRTYNDLFDMRQSSDYEDFTYHSHEDVEEMLPKAKEFIQTIENLINT